MTDNRFAIVVGIGPSEYADAVLEHAFDQALRHERPVLHVLAVGAVADEDARARLIKRVLVALEDAVPAERSADWTIIAHVQTGRPEEEIVELASETFARLIVIGRFEHQAIADRVVAHADCPVLVVTPPRDTAASEAQCPDCVEARRTTGGEQWFCDRHHGERLGHVVVTSTSWSDASRSMW